MCMAVTTIFNNEGYPSTNQQFNTPQLPVWRFFFISHLCEIISDSESGGFVVDGLYEGVWQTRQL